MLRKDSSEKKAENRKQNVFQKFSLRISLQKVWKKFERKNSKLRI